ncbi:MAG: hypothetical protein V2A66_07420 [Pseudomonadota bacterium]
MNNPIDSILDAAASLARMKAFGRPAGIVFAWGALLYAAIIFSGKLLILLDASGRARLPVMDGAATWAILVAAFIALVRRRLIARMFGGMAMALLLFHSIFHQELFGILLSLLCLPCLIINRRWFYEKLPRE